MNQSNIYDPVPCGLHSLYEWAATHRLVVRLTWHESDRKISHKVKVIDLMTRDRAEYLMVMFNHEAVEIRLDKIIELDPMGNRTFLELQRQYDLIANHNND